MRPFILSLLLITTSQAFAEGFILRPSGDNQICKIMDSGRTERCYERLSRFDIYEPLSASAVVPDHIEIVDEVRLARRNSAGTTNAIFNIQGMEQAYLDSLMSMSSGLVLSPNNQARVLQEFRRLNVRHVAIDRESIRESGNEAQIPFVASVYWIDRIDPTQNATIHLEGDFIIPKASIGLLLGPPSLNDTLRDYSEVEHFFDSTTAWNLPWLRFLETANRLSHFRLAFQEGIAMSRAQVDQKTIDFLEEIIGPAILGKLYVPYTLELKQRSAIPLNQWLIHKITSPTAPLR